MYFIVSLPQSMQASTKSTFDVNLKKKFTYSTKLLGPLKRSYHYQDNIMEIKKSDSLHESQIKLMHNYANMFMKIEKYEEAYFQITSSLLLNSNIWVTYLLESVISFQLGLYEKAYHSTFSAAKLYKKNSEIYLMRGLALLGLQRYSDAIPMFNSCLEIDSQDMEAYNGRAYAYFNIQNFNEALADYRRSIEINSYFYEGLYNIANTYFHLKKYDLAIKYSTSSLSLNSKFYYVYSIRGRSYMMLGMRSDALSDMNRYIKSDPNNAMMLGYRGELFENEGHYEDALNDYRTALGLDEDNSFKLYFRIAEVYFELKNFKEAVSNYNNYLLVYSRDPDALLKKAKAQYELSHYAATHKTLDKLFNYFPKNDTALTFKAMIYDEEGKKEQAISSYYLSISLNPENFPAHHNLAIMLAQAQRNEEAVKILNNGSKINNIYFDSLLLLQSKPS